MTISGTKLFAIIQKEYRQVVKKKSFIIATIITPLLLGGFFFLPALVTQVGRQAKTIAIMDYSGLVRAPLLEKNHTPAARALQLTLAPLGPDPEQERLIPGDRAGAPQSLQLLPQYRDQILNRAIDGLILVPRDLGQGRQIYFCAANISDFEINNYITKIVRDVLTRHILANRGVPPSVIDGALRGVSIGTFKVKKEGTTPSTSGTEYLVSVFMLTVLFTVIMAYGQLTMRGVLEEKNNRIIEVLISSTNVPTLFYGKITGIGLAGLTQVALWMGLALVLLKPVAGGLNRRVSDFLTPETALYFILFFIIGYFMYAILFAIVGASVNTDQEAQQFAAPITYLLVTPFIIGIMITQNPHTPLAVIASLFPLFTPTLMFMRINIAPPPTAQILLSIGGSLLFTLFLAWLGAKIYRTGILMYGKKPTLREIIKWIRYK